VDGWGEIEIKANSAQLKLELRLSLAIWKLVFVDDTRNKNCIMILLPEPAILDSVFSLDRIIHFHCDLFVYSFFSLTTSTGIANKS
jgi:hypothetical protein